jgi:tetratricopeptide (TPR) repeat protein
MVGNRAQWIEIVAEIGRHYYYRGRAAEGLRWLEPQVAALEATAGADLPGHLLAPVYQALAIMYKALGRCAEAVAMTARSVERSREAGARVALATALYRHGFALFDVVGGIEGMRTVALEAVGMAEVAGDVNALVWALYQLAEAHRIKGEWDPYRANADRALEAAERRGNPGPLESLVRARSIAAFYMGD